MLAMLVLLYATGNGPSPAGSCGGPRRGAAYVEIQPPRRQKRAAAAAEEEEEGGSAV